MSKQFWAVIAVIVVLFLGVAMFNKSDTENTSGNGDASVASNHVKGEGTTGVTLVEYGDFQCPYCQVYHSTVNEVVAYYGDQISFQFVHFPLQSIHQNAFAASRAAEAAGKQGKFWEMYDKIYENADPAGQTGWVASNAPSSFFEQYAQQIGLNVEQFKTDAASSAINKIVNADLTKGTEAGVESTPTFFLNGKKVTINNTVEDFKAAIDKAIAEKGGASNSDASGDAAGIEEAQQ